MGSFKANLDIYLGKSRTTLMGTQKHVESFNLQEIEKKYNLKFRYSLDEPIDIDPENKFSYAEDKNNPMDNGNLV